MKKTILLKLALLMCILITACGKPVPKIPDPEPLPAETPDAAPAQNEGGEGGLSPELAKAYLAEVDELASHLGFSEDEGLQGEYLHGGFISDWDGDSIPEMCLLLKTSPRDPAGWDGTPRYGWFAPTFYLYRCINGRAARIAECDLYFATGGREASVSALTTESGTKAVWYDHDDTTGEGYAVCFEMVNGTIERKDAPADMAEAAKNVDNAHDFLQTLEGDILPLLYNYSGDARIEVVANARELREALAHTAGVSTGVDIVKPAEAAAPAFNADDFIGYYTDGNYNTVTIDKNGADYIMEVSIYRLTTIDEGTVSITANGVLFNALDAMGDPILLSFRSVGNGRFTLKVEETTWPLLIRSTIFSGFEKTERPAE